MSTLDFIARPSTSPGAGSAAYRGSTTGLSRVMTATSCVSAPWRPDPQPRHQSGLLWTTPIAASWSGGAAEVETSAGLVGSKQCAAVKNVVGERNDPVQTKLPPPGASCSARPTYG